MRPRSWLARPVAVEPLACHHDRGADADPVKQVNDVLVVHANAAIRGKGADRGRLIGAVNGILTARQGHRARTPRIVWRPTGDYVGQLRVVGPDLVGGRPGGLDILAADLSGA